MPIYKTNTQELWPILVRVVNAKDTQPFAVSVFLGKTKPPSLETFLRPFIDEARELMDHGLTVNEIHYRVEIANFTCDAPARQFIKASAGHCAREGCERCTQRGTYFKSTICITYPFNSFHNIGTL